MTPGARFIIAVVVFFIFLALTWITERRGRPLPFVLAGRLIAAGHRLGDRFPRLGRRVEAAGLGIEHGYSLYRECTDGQD